MERKSVSRRWVFRVSLSLSESEMWRIDRDGRASSARQFGRGRAGEGGRERFIVAFLSVSITKKNKNKTRTPRQTVPRRRQRLVASPAKVGTFFLFSFIYLFFHFPEFPSQWIFLCAAFDAVELGGTGFFNTVSTGFQWSSLQFWLDDEDHSDVLSVLPDLNAHWLATSRVLMRLEWLILVSTRSMRIFTSHKRRTNCLVFQEEPVIGSQPVVCQSDAALHLRMHLLRLADGFFFQICNLHLVLTDRMAIVGFTGIHFGYFQFYSRNNSYRISSFVCMVIYWLTGCMVD